MEIYKKCLIILPYFGKFNQYFVAFLQSCKFNDRFNWLIMTDIVRNDYPENFVVRYMSFNDFTNFVQSKFDFKICLNNPYKLCDYKPAYGYIFEEFLSGYDYWGYCDCDLIFGNLNKMLLPLLNCNYDKIFAPGHLSIYKNTFENNRRFMKTINNRICYKEAFSTDKIYVFDESYRQYNILTIFKNDNTNLFLKDISFNVDSNNMYLSRSKYNFLNDKFECDGTPFKIFWLNGSLIGFEIKGNNYTKKEFLYCHLQNRKIRFKRISNNYMIASDRIIGLKSDSIDFKKLVKSPKKSYFTRIDRIIKKIKFKILKRNKRYFYFE